MKKIMFLALAALLSTSTLYAQHHCGGCGKHNQQQCSQAATVNADGIAMEIVRVFPSVKSVTKTTQWTEVYDAKRQLLGYAIYSKPASDGIKGYLGETPLLIALSPDKKVLSVEMLKNNETPAYAKKVSDSGLLKQWNGLTIKKAKKKKVELVSGATYTSRSVVETFQAAIKNLK